MKKIFFVRVLLNCFFALFIIFSMLAVPHYSYGASSNTTLSITLNNPLGDTADIPSFIQKDLEGLVLLLTPVIVVMFLWTGFLFIKSEGNPEQLKTAKAALMYTIIGAALVLGAKGFSLVIASTVANL